MAKHLDTMTRSSFQRFTSRSLPGQQPTPLGSSWAATFFELREAGYETRIDAKRRVLSAGAMANSQKNTPSWQWQRRFRVPLFAVAALLAGLIGWNVVPLQPKTPVHDIAIASHNPSAKKTSYCSLDSASVLNSVNAKTVWDNLGGVRFATVRVRCAKGSPMVRILQRTSDGSLESFRRFD